MAIRKVQVDLEDRLAKLFGSISRARILSFLLANSGMNFCQRENIFLTENSELGYNLKIFFEGEFE